MNILFACLMLSTTAFAAEKILEKGTATYEVKAFMKTVGGQSDALKGKMVCKDTDCEFLLAAPVKSFQSKDSNRDLNMLTVLEAEKYPLVSVKGFVAEAKLSGQKFTTEVVVNFHGVEKKYPVTISPGKALVGDFVLDLEAHKVERPSLLAVKIENSVPVHFELHWK